MPTVQARRGPACLLCLLGVGLAALSVAGCRGAGEEVSPAADRPHYVTTIPPIASIVAPLVGARGRVTTLLTAGDSPHTYAPRPSDVGRAEAGAAVFYGAQHLDAWAAELPAPRHIPLIQLVPESFRRPAVSDTSALEDAARSIDPHFWTDPLAVRALLPALVDTLCVLDTPGCTTYSTNVDSLAAALTELDIQLQNLLEPVRSAPVLLAQPFFQYFMHRYGPHLVGVVEPNPGTEPSPQELQALIGQARREQVAAVFTQHQLPPRAARAVAEAAGVPVIPLDPLGGTDDLQTYHDLLLHNARTIRDALSPPPIVP